MGLSSKRLGDGMRIFIFLCMVLFSNVTIANPAIEFLKQEEKRRENKTETTNNSNKTIKKTKEKRYFNLSNGKRVDISDWAIVHFMSSTCSYCRSFDPKLKQILNQTGIPVYVYSFDGQGDESFPDVLQPTEEELSLFFAELPRATPTDFLINVNNLTAIPISQGDTSTYAFIQRLDETFSYIDKNLKGLMDNAK